MRPRDLLLVVVALLGVAGGVLFPGPAGVITPLVLYLMCTILFMSFLRIDFAALVRISRKDLAEVAVWSLVKLVVMPIFFWALATWLAPAFALPVLLLSGVSTGVTAPFFAQVMGADDTRALQLTVATSLVVWLSLPALAELLMGRQMEIPFWHMARMLLLVIFLPLALALAVRRWLPGWLGPLGKIQYPLSVVMFFVINLGVFASYSAFLLEHQGQVLAAVVVAFLVCGASALTGLVLGRLGGRRLDGLTGAVGLTFVNNILVVVFAARFFEVEAPLLSAVYLLPFFLIVAPMRWAAQHRLF